jgi:hypothetical protein
METVSERTEKRGDRHRVRNEVTPPGVWKPEQHRVGAEVVQQLRVRNEVTSWMNPVYTGALATLAISCRHRSTGWNMTRMLRAARTLRQLNVVLDAPGGRVDDLYLQDGTCTSQSSSCTTATVTIDDWR